MKMQTIVTTSWDDGHPSDLRIAELLRSRHIGGTFYVLMTGRHGGPILHASHLKFLSKEGFEIGAHGLTHQALPQFESKELAREVGVCKKNLEDILGEEVQMFCYPKGRYNDNVIKHVEQAGYKGARTTRWLGYRFDFHPFKMPTTLHAYPHLTWHYFRNAARAKNLSGLFDYFTRFWQVTRWVDLGKQMFDGVREKGGVWHLYGHSWLVDELNLWADLTELLDYVSMRKDVTYVSNAELLSLSLSQGKMAHASLKRKRCNGETTSR